MAIKQITKEISEASLNEMCNDDFKNNFITLLRSRYPLFYITTNEEQRFVTFLEHFCRARGYECFLWDSYSGLVNVASKEEVLVTTTENLKNNPLAILDYIISEGKSYEKKKAEDDAKKANNIANVEAKKDGKESNGTIFVLLDYFRFIDKNPDIERRFRAITQVNSFNATIITGPSYVTTEVLQNLVPVIDFPYANEKEIKHALYQVVKGAERRLPNIFKDTQIVEEDLINSVRGLTLMEAQTAFSKSLVFHREWNIKTILSEKRQIIKKSGMLEYYDQTVPMENVGGLKNLIEWIKQRKRTFSKEAVEYGLKNPRGLLTIGMPGSGKSLVCKSISSTWGVPLLRLDFGRLFDSLVGSSERNSREAMKIAEAVAPCILWIDEIEKAISGVKSSNNSDGGTTSRVLSTFLTWMQEKTSPVFVVATANDHEAIPPEFLRAGRFDEIFFVDLPNVEEREEIFNILLKLRKINQDKINTALLSERSDGYSGAEIEKAIDNSMLKAFLDSKREVFTDDIKIALTEFTPLSVMRAADFTILKEWSQEHCRKANREPKKIVNHGNTSAKDLDLD